MKSTRRTNYIFNLTRFCVVLKQLGIEIDKGNKQILNTNKRKKKYYFQFEFLHCYYDITFHLDFYTSHNFIIHSYIFIEIYTRLYH